LAEPNIEELLRQGVDAARSGDKLTARRLLQQVLLNDKHNVTALMWMASVVDTLEDRRAYLQRVLQVDPNNERAREALRRLGGVPAPAAAPSRPAVQQVPSNGGSRTGLFVLAIVALVAVVMILLVITTPGLLTSVAVQPSATSLPPTETASGVQVMPTLTVNAVSVPIEERTLARTLPPTFTPPPTLEPTVAPTETPPPPSVNQYAFVSSDLGVGAAEFTLRYFASADGQPILIGDGIGSDAAISADQSQIAFIRVITPEGEATPEAGAEGESVSSTQSQLFVADLAPDFSTLTNIRQLTTVVTAQLLWPSFSADGQWIAFASGEDGDMDIYRVSLFHGGIDKLTANATFDSYPAYHPTDPNVLLYASDLQSPGFTDLYVLNLSDLSEPPVRLYDGAGSAYQPSWSADGSQIAFISTANADPDVFIVNADGSRARQLTIDDGASEDRAPVWTPDNAYIAFASNREGDTFQWYVVNFASSEVTPLVSDENSAGRLAFVP